MRDVINQKCRSTAKKGDSKKDASWFLCNLRLGDVSPGPPTVTVGASCQSLWDCSRIMCHKKVVNASWLLALYTPRSLQVGTHELSITIHTDILYMLFWFWKHFGKQVKHIIETWYRVVMVYQASSVSDSRVITRPDDDPTKILVMDPRLSKFAEGENVFICGKRVSIRVVHWG